MKIHYPAGVKAPTNSAEITSKKKRRIRPKIAAGNRGMAFEAAINDTNTYYLEKGVAVIHKKPTPIRIVKVDYQKGAKITEAYFQEPSTTDYNGIYRGKYIDFEAKSTHSAASFPLSNIAPQQVKHLRAVLKLGAIAFFLIDIVKTNEVYLVPATYICDFYEQKPRGSIPLSEIRTHGYRVLEKYNPRLDYLPILDEYFFQ